MGARRGATEGAFTILEAAVAGAIVTVLLSGVFLLNAQMMHLLESSTGTTNASAHLRSRVEAVRLANWSQLTDPNWFVNELLQRPTDSASNLPGFSETCTVSPFQSPCSGAPQTMPPPPFTVTRQANGDIAVSPAGYPYTALLAQQEILQIDLSITWAGLGRTRTRAQSALISPWGISK